MAYVNGRINDQLDALVHLRLVAGREVECLVDTGARCALVLPHALVDELGLTITGGFKELEMVGHSRKRALVALAQIEWLGERRYVEVIIQDDFLIGTELLEDARLVIDYPARTLTISRNEEA